jgi:hypothetical protein
MLQNQDVWVWTGFSWIRIASISGMSYENGNRQMTKFLSRGATVSCRRRALLRVLVPGGTWWPQLSRSLHRGLSHGFDTRAAPVGVRLWLGCGDGRPERFVSSLIRTPSAGLASYSLTEHREWISTTSHRTAMKDEPHPCNVIRSVHSDYKHLCIPIDAHYIKLQVYMVRWYSFSYFRKKKHALMCKIREQDKVSVLKHVLCSLMDMSDFFIWQCLIP